MELDDKYYANDGDLLYTWSATFGPHIWRGDRVIYHYHIWKIDLTDELEKHFAVQLLEQDKNDILSGHNGSTMAHITKEGMEQKKVVIPKNIGEQRQLGLFFDNLDNLITLHQSKAKSWENKKKRFLTISWEQRKLKDFGKATGGTSIESEFSDDGKYKVISIGSYSEDSVYRDQGIRAIESEKTKNRVLNEGDLTMILNDKTASGNIIGRALLIEKSGVYVYNQRTERIEIDHEKFDSLFIYEMLNAVRAG